MTFVVMSEKGQVTIPQEIRRKLHLGKGDPLSVMLTDGGGIVLKPAAMFPVEMYSKERMEEFEREDRMTPSEKKSLRKGLNGKRP